MRAALALLILLLCHACTASALGALPTGCVTAQPGINIAVTGGALVYCASITVCSTDGTSYNFTGVYKNSPSKSAPLFVATFTGKAVCSTTNEFLILTLDPGSCSQAGSPTPDFCLAAASLYAGEFHYGVSSNGGGTLEIDQWSGSTLPILFSCSSPGLCSFSLACNTTSVTTLQFFISGGNVTATNSQVILAPNSTSVFQGNQVTITDSTQVTIQQSNSTTTTQVTVEGDQNTFNFSTQASTFYQFFTTAPSSCKNYAAVEASRATNLSISSTAFNRVLFTSSSLNAPGSDWSLSPDISTLQFNDGNSNGQFAYSITGCLLEGALFNPSAVGQRVVLALFNVTTGITPTQIASAASSANPSNDTNPTFLTAVCVTALISSVFTGNRFGLSIGLEHTDGSSALGLLALSSYRLYAVPLACQGNSLNINISADFNGSQLEAGTCIDIDNPGVDRVRVNNMGVCGIQVTDLGEEPKKVEHETFWQHAWHRLKELTLGATVTLAGTPIFDDSTGGAAIITPRHTTGSHIEWRIQCPLDCGEDPIETNGECKCGEVSSEGSISTNDTCTCQQGVESHGPVTTNDTCTCSEGVSSEGPIETPDTCHCGTSITTEGSVTASQCGCDEVTTNTVQSPTGLPINFPNGATFSPRTPVTIVFDPNQPSLSSISTSSSSGSSGSSSSGTSGEPSAPGLPGGGGCSPGSLLLKPGEKLVGYDKDGNKLYLIGSVLHSASHAASSATSAATSAAGAATSAATAIATAVTGLLCHGGGVPVPHSLGSGVPSLPTSGIPNLNDPASITGPTVNAAFSTPSTTSVPDPTTFNAALAAAVSAVTTSQLPANGPTSIVVNTGGLQVPIFNNSEPLPTCGGTDRGDLSLLLGNGTTDDKLIICSNKPSLEGFAYYEIPTTTAVVSAIFRGNGTGLVCLPDDNWCEIDSYPNNTLFAIRPTQKITPGSCTFCTLTWNSAGELLEATSGNITQYNTTTSLVNVTQYLTNSMIALDNESSVVNAGYTVQNQVLTQDENVTGTFQLGAAFVFPGTTSETRSGCFAPGVITVSSTSPITSGPTTLNCGVLELLFSVSIAATTTFTVTVEKPFASSPVQALRQYGLQDYNHVERPVFVTTSLTGSQLNFFFTAGALSIQAGSSFSVYWEWVNLSPVAP